MKRLMLLLLFAALPVQAEELPIASEPYAQAGNALAPQAIPAEELRHITMLVYRNECSSRAENLVSWNEGEEFPSLGIGHFIWYPEGYSGPFIESFPDLLRLMRDRDVPMPRWLSVHSDAPWPSREAFLADSGSRKQDDLRQLLLATMELQTEFMMQRMLDSAATMTEGMAESDRQRISALVEAIRREPMGNYALIDYVNFKGEGVSPSERYQGRGWGLLQVLLEMRSQSDRQESMLIRFADAADRVLEKRVSLAPNERHEERWLPGWKNRIQSYRLAAEGAL